MPNYQNSKIYRIVCDETNLTYYGSTVQSLCRRMTEHKSMLKKGRSSGIKGMIRPKIYLIEKYPCNCREELHAKERLYIENNECINKIIPLRSIKEWHQDNKIKVQKSQKEYRNNNEEKIKELQRKHYEKNKESIKAKRRERNRLKKQNDYS